MSDLIITAVGSAEIPIKGSGSRHRIVEIQAIDKNGEMQKVGFFSLMDLLRALNAPDKVPARVEEARFVGRLCVPANGS